MRTDHQHRRELRLGDRSIGHLDRRYRETKGVDRPDGTWSRLLAPVVQPISTRSHPDTATEKLGRQRQLPREPKCFRRTRLSESNAMKTIDQLPRALGASTRVCRCKCSFHDVAPPISDMKSRRLLCGKPPRSLWRPLALPSGRRRDLLGSA
jgi:hypothetical protein